MKLRPWIGTLILAVCTFAMLFGAFSLYQHTMLERPIQQVVAHQESFQIEQLDVDLERLSLQLAMKRVTPEWRGEYLEIEKVLQQTGNEGQNTISIMVEQDWQNIWDQLYMLIATAIAHRDYSQLMTQANTWQAMLGVDRIHFSMDPEHLFIMVTKDDASLVQVLPIQLEKGGGGIATGMVAGNMGG